MKVRGATQNFREFEYTAQTISKFEKLPTISLCDGNALNFTKKTSAVAL